MGPKSNRKSIGKDAVPSSSAVSSVVHSTCTGDDMPVEQLNVSLTQLAKDMWAGNVDKVPQFDEAIIHRVFTKEICEHDSERMRLLESSGYLEVYLLPNFQERSSIEHLLSTMLIINEKSVQSSTVFSDLLQRSITEEKVFGVLIDKAVDLFISEDANTSLSSQHHVGLVHFLSLCIQSLEVAVVRDHILRLLSFPMWTILSKTRLHDVLADSPELSSAWEKFQSHVSNLDASENQLPTTKRKRPLKDSSSQTDVDVKMALKRTINRDCQFVPTLLKLIFTSVNSVDCSSELMENLLDLLLSILGQVPTRRFVTTVLSDCHFYLRLQHSNFVKQLTNSRDNNIIKLVEMVTHALRVPLNDISGRLRTRADVLDEVQNRFSALQQTSFALHPELLRDIIFGTLSSVVQNSDSLRQCFALLSDQQLTDLAVKLKVVSQENLEEKSIFADRETLIEAFLLWLSPSCDFAEDFVRDVPLLPTESLLWDEETLQIGKTIGFRSARKVLPLPKLNLQFLSVHDYLTRNFELFRLESAFSIRQDLEDAIARMNPVPAAAPVMTQLMATQLTVYSAHTSSSRKNAISQNSQSIEKPKSSVTFSGQSRYGVRIQSVSVGDVTPPSIGERTPRRVSLFVTIDLSSFQGDKRREWESIKEHDVLFLVTIVKPTKECDRNNGDNFCKTFGVKYVRGATVSQIRDEADVVLNDSSIPDERPLGRVGGVRKLRLIVDPAQYIQDIDNQLEVYESFNLLIRRDARENNFKAVLETIRDVACTASIGRSIPSWLTEVFLGYGDVTCASPQHETPEIEEIDFADTFLDMKHILDSFSNAKQVFLEMDGKTSVVDSSSAYELPEKSFIKLRFCRPSGAIKKARTKELQFVDAHAWDSVTIVPYFSPPTGPYPEDNMRRNGVRFTAAQCYAIRQSVGREGLSLIVGPPGTGKTDVAVQIVSTLYHNYPQQRLLIVTHSNAALNDIFEKIMNKGVDPRHCLRLGSGEVELREMLSGSTAATVASNTEKIFSKTGRVNASLIRRLGLLAQVQRLSGSLSLFGDAGHSCETAELFYQSQIAPRMRKFEAVLSDQSTAAADIANSFPFHSFFADVSQRLFVNDTKVDKLSAEGCLNHINRLFDELRDYRALELLRTQSLRCDYLLTNQAKIVAMTCTHAAIMRRRLVELGFKFDSIVMEEAGQILEVETLIPILAQDTDSADKDSRLKRVTLIGDHLQLPPIVQHSVLKSFSHLEQSMFTRFIRLGVPFSLLDQQGRARAEIANLYRHRYSSMGASKSQLLDMPMVTTLPKYKKANTGFVHTMQFVDVGDLNGKGEVSPSPHSYQNQAEAEYVVAVYQFMRLLGYPAEKISLLTTYNGQKSLLKEIVQNRCCGAKNNAYFGRPGHIMTVDEFQGRQNDYVLLSLVRSQSVGHVRDIRRLTVALSRARLGLYIFGREQLFRSALELQQTLQSLFAKGTKLSLIAGEAFPCERESSEVIAESRRLNVEDVTAMGILVYQMVQQAQFLEQQKSVQ